MDLDTVEETPQFILSVTSGLVTAWYFLLRMFAKIPGGVLILDYIRASHKNDPWRTLLEIALALLAVRYFFASKYSQDERDKMVLSEKDVDELIEDWVPEPIVPKVRKDELWIAQSTPKIVGGVNPHVTLNNASNVLDFSSKDYLNMSTNKLVIEKSVAQVRASGVGACGPPNFYGTQDVHVRCQEDLARFLGGEEGLLYGMDYCTPTSVLPCFLKRGDIVIVDGGVSLALQRAVVISRCDVEWYNHNDLDHLEEILESLEEELAEGPLNRRFIVTEGLFENFGDSPDLKRLVEIKNRYKFRLVLDETNSVGSLGANGRGLPEVYGIDRKEIEITIGSLAQSFGASGGYCVGCHDMILHQILSSNAYVFSASLPPFSAVACSTVIHQIEDAETDNGPNPILAPLQQNAKSLCDHFKTLKHVLVRSQPHSPVVHLRIDPELRKSLGLPAGYGGPGSAIQHAVKKGEEDEYFDPLYNAECYLLQKIVDQALSENVLITRTKRILHHELLPVVPELLIHANSAFTSQELANAEKVIDKAIVDNLEGITKESLMSDFN